MTSVPAPAGRGPAAQKARILVSIIFGIFMVILDTTVINVAFQALRSEFGASLNDSQWIISIYVLAMGISMPLTGFLSKRFGLKRTYLAGLVIFAGGSLLCGFAPSLNFLVVARAIQGVGGGLAMPLGAAILIRSFPPEEQGKALGYYGIASLVAPALGPILGGILVDHNLWRFIFFINPPIGLLGFVLGSRFLPPLKDEGQPRLDLLGLLTEIVGFGAILYAASVAANFGWSAPGVWTWFGVGLAGLLAFGAVELFVASEPLLDLRLFQKPVFLIASLLGYVGVIALFGAEFLLPIYLQFLRGRTAFATGLILLPMAVTGGVVTILAGQLYDRVGPRLLLAFGYGMLIVNTWQLSQLKADTPIAWIMFLLVLRGLALGATIQTTFVTALSVVPLKQVAQGSSLTNATRQVAQAIGVAILATVLAAALSPRIAALQQAFMDQPVQAGAAPLAVCAPPGAPRAALAPASGATADFFAQLGQVCRENIAGFEQAYRITFFASIVALALGLLLPGWPLKWAGRRAADVPPPAH
ncbi:MAG TPA: MDR family MFS transporter [Rhodocyclaceae bacterium]|nr:MDR family MFS transporter [Rhodocyclaceae bacterium]